MPDKKIEDDYYAQATSPESVPETETSKPKLQIK